MSAVEKARLWLFDKFTGCARRGYLNWMPDKPFLRVQYFLKLGRALRLKKPLLYNEKLQWIKLYDRNPAYPRYIDKIAVREYVREKVGEQYLIPAICTCDRVEDIPWETLPARFVIKCSHGSSSNIICRDKSKLDIEDAKKKLKRWFSMNWFWLSREWPYKDVQPRILIEEFLESDTGDVPYDYKCMCFGGEPQYVIVDADRYIRHTRNFYDTDWVKQDMFNRHPNIPRAIERPAKLEEMLFVARTLSAGIPHVRVDLYTVSDRVYFGEMTFFHGYGMEVFRPRAFEVHMGDLIVLPKAGEA